MLDNMSSNCRSSAAAAAVAANRASPSTSSSSSTPSSIMVQHACNCFNDAKKIFHPDGEKRLIVLEEHCSSNASTNESSSSSSSSSRNHVEVTHSQSSAAAASNGVATKSIPTNNVNTTDNDANYNSSSNNTYQNTHQTSGNFFNYTDQSGPNRKHICRNYHVENNLPYPPPLPEPKYSFYRRVLPQSLIQLSSPYGKTLFKESLMNQTAESFFPLSEQFLNQSDPAYCGVTSLIMILNAIGIDPNIRWKGGWRWYGSEEMILNGCCIESERVRRAGISMEEYQSLGRCQGLQVFLKRPVLSFEKKESSSDESGDGINNSNSKTCDEGGIEEEKEEEEQLFTIEEFRKDVKQMTQNPPIYELLESEENTVNHHDNEESHEQRSKINGGFLVVSFSRSTLGQTGDGHFSPVAAYHESTDRCLILDVARFKYSPYWVSVTDLYEAMKPVDKTTQKSRGWFMNHPPDITTSNTSNNSNSIRSHIPNGSNNNNTAGTNPFNKEDDTIIQKEGVKTGGYRGSKAVDEWKRPASSVPLFESGIDTEACPVGKIKVKYCSSAEKS